MLTAAGRPARPSTPATTHRPTPHVQRGAAALGMVLVMLGIMALAMLYLNRGLLVEIRSAADHRRAAAAFEAAEAGVEWATAMLNDPRKLDDRCAPDATAGSSFRDRYLPLEIESWADTGNPAPDSTAASTAAFALSAASAPDIPRTTLVPQPDDRIVCRLDDDGLPCVCPPPAQRPMPDPTYGAHFTVSLAPVAGHGDSVRVVSRGCIGEGHACARAFEPVGATASNAGATATPRPDALSRVQVMLKLAPRLLRTPTAALTAGSDVRLGTTSLVNLSPRGGGWLVHAGSTVSSDVDGAGDAAGGPAASRARAAANVRRVDAPGASMQSTAGTPAASRLASNDALLAALPPGGLLRQLLGQSVERFGDDAGVRRIGSCTPVACGHELDRLERAGWRSFLVDGDVLLPARDLGTGQSPVAIVSTGAIGFAGSSEVTGMLMTSGSWPSSGPGRGRVVGAAVAGLDAGRPTLDAVTYDAGVLARLRASGPLLRVPGSWSDE